MGKNCHFYRRVIFNICCLLVVISKITERCKNAFVTKVISGPYEEYGKWWVDVEYISWGVPGKSRLMFDSREQAQEVQEGFRFLT